MQWPHLIDNSLKAHHLYKRDVNYVVQEGEVVIVDEFTGRLMLVLAQVSSMKTSRAGSSRL